MVQFTIFFFQLEDFSNKVANYFRQEGYQPGDSVALLLENRPEYVGLWLGLSKIGVITALINTNLVSGPLMHSLSAAHCKAIIYGSDFENGKLFSYTCQNFSKEKICLVFANFFCTLKTTLPKGWYLLFTNSLCNVQNCENIS